jgi:hypothetical protein
VTPIPTLYNDVEPHAAQYWESQITSYTLQDNIDTLTHATWKDIPSTYLLCTLDQAIPIAMQRLFVSMVQDKNTPWKGLTGEKELRVETLEAGHFPFLSMPAKVADSVAQACKM